MVANRVGGYFVTTNYKWEPIDLHLLVVGFTPRKPVLKIQIQGDYNGVSHERGIVLEWEAEILSFQWGKRRVGSHI